MWTLTVAAIMRLIRISYSEPEASFGRNWFIFCIFMKEIKKVSSSLLDPFKPQNLKDGGSSGP
jgi:hypothetical protein